MSNKRNNRKKLTAVSIVAIAVIGILIALNLSGILQKDRSQNSPDDVISLANSLGVPVYIIGTGSFDTSALEEIANSTNGRYWDADTINDVGDIFSEIYSGNKSMYCIEYDSDKSAKPTARGR